MMFGISFNIKNSSDGYDSGSSDSTISAQTISQILSTRSSSTVINSDAKLFYPESLTPCV